MLHLLHEFAGCIKQRIEQRTYILKNLKNCLANQQLTNVRQTTNIINSYVIYSVSRLSLFEHRDEIHRIPDGFLSHDNKTPSSFRSRQDDKEPPLCSTPLWTCWNPSDLIVMPLQHHPEPFADHPVKADTCSALLRRSCHSGSSPAPARTNSHIDIFIKTLIKLLEQRNSYHL